MKEPQWLDLAFTIQHEEEKFDIRLWEINRFQMLENMANCALFGKSSIKDVPLNWQRKCIDIDETGAPVWSYSFDTIRK